MASFEIYPRRNALRLPIRILQVITLATLCLTARSDGIGPIPRRLLPLPRLTLWAWERSEDLRQIDPKTTAIAFLDRTIEVGSKGMVQSLPRIEPVIFPVKTPKIAVVRLEMPGTTEASPQLRQRVLEAMLLSAGRPGLAAFQVDFDATHSQREFYRRLLLDLRREMPADLPLSMTALASWCSWDDWIHGLPVDEAVPMFFRMEPDRLGGVAGRAEYRVREPLCQGSIGVSTREAWPHEETAGRRIYLFPDLGWRRDAPVLAAVAHSWRSH